MSTSNTRSLATMCVTVLLITACSDGAVVSEHSAQDGALVSTAPAVAQFMSVRERERLRRRNSLEWVGTAHNKMIDDFRQEVRNPGLLTNDICVYVTGFSTSADRLPDGKAFLEGAGWRALRGVRQSSLCGNKRRDMASHSSFRYVSAAVSYTAPQSATAYSLLDAVESAVTNASDAYDLANRLNSILDQATALSTLDEEAIGSAVSVAQNSFEYWQDQYLPFESEIIAEYSPCVEEQLSNNDDDPISTCMLGKDDAAFTSRELRQRSNFLRFAGTNSPTMCPPGLREGFKRIAVADAKGAFSGFFGAALAGGPGAGVLGALAGGGAASIWAAGENALQTLKCIYGLH